jgi:poly(beta-D-mannuronate) lyase
MRQRRGWTLRNCRTIGALVFVLALALARGAGACTSPPPPVRDLDIPRFYGDAAGTVVDPKRAAQHEAAVAPLNAFLRHVTQEADKALKETKERERRERAACAVRWLAAWAQGDAWLGRMASQQAEYQRKWDAGGVALAYLKLKPYATPAERAVIAPWLIRLADASRAFFDDPARQRNNHWYWLGLGQAAVALAAESPRHWEIARGIMRDAARDIAADGTLAAETARGSRALFYHVFALVPLVVAAEVAASRGEDWYAFGDGALHRLAGLVHKGLADPKLFDKLAGVAQERPVNARYAWLQLYLRRFPARLAGPHPIVAEGNRWIGGSGAVLLDALSKRR